MFVYLINYDCLNKLLPNTHSHTSLITGYTRNRAAQCSTVESTDLLFILMRCGFVCFQAEIQDELLDVQPHFRRELLDAVSQFTVDVEDFEVSYNEVLLLYFILNIFLFLVHSHNYLEMSYL